MLAVRVVLCCALTGSAVALTLSAGGSEVPAGVCGDTVPDVAKVQSLAEHQIPKWYQDAKFGISVHWGLYSVPAFAPPLPYTAGKNFEKKDSAEKEKLNPSSCEYLQTSMIPDSPTAQFHKEHYGEEPSEASYLRHFVPAFDAESKKWEPEAWAELFKNAGAKYVLMAAKEKDGFALWDSSVTKQHSSRDVVGELTTAVRGAGMEMGVIYNGQANSSVDVADELDELIVKYKPSILLGSLPVDPPTTPSRLLDTFADYLNNRCSQGLVDSPWFQNMENISYQGDIHTIFSHAEIGDSVWATPFQLAKPMGRSWGFNDGEDAEFTRTPGNLARDLAFVTSMNGHLQLDVGPRADGSLHDLQALALRDLGTWMETNSEAIHGTRPFLEPGTRALEEFSFMRTDKYVYVIIMRPDNEAYISIPNRDLNKQGRVLAVDVLTPSGKKGCGQLPDGRLILPDQADNLAFPKGFPLVVRLKLARE